MIAGRSLFRSEVFPPESLPPSVDKGLKALDELSSVTKLESEAEDERPDVGNVDREEPLVIDERNKVIGTFPRASGSRPTSSAAVALKLSAFCAKLATTVCEGVGTTDCDVDEGPLGNSRSARDVERVSNRTSVKRRTRVLSCGGLLGHVNSIAALAPLGPRLRRNVLTSRTCRI